jgi:hypothetical protein
VLESVLAAGGMEEASGSALERAGDSIMISIAVLRNTGAAHAKKGPRTFRLRDKAIRREEITNIPFESAIVGSVVRLTEDAALKTAAPSQRG